MVFIWLVEDCFGVNGSWFGCGSLVSDYLLELWVSFGWCVVSVA